MKKWIDNKFVIKENLKAVPFTFKLEKTEK